MKWVTFIIIHEQQTENKMKNNKSPLEGCATNKTTVSDCHSSYSHTYIYVQTSILQKSPNHMLPLMCTKVHSQIYNTHVQLYYCTCTSALVGRS